MDIWFLITTLSDIVSYTHTKLAEIVPIPSAMSQKGSIEKSIETFSKINFVIKFLGAMVDALNPIGYNLFGFKV